MERNYGVGFCAGCLFISRMVGRKDIVRPKRLCMSDKEAEAGEKAKETASPEREQIACQPVVWAERHGFEHRRTDDDRNLL